MLTTKNSTQANMGVFDITISKQELAESGMSAAVSYSMEIIFLRSSKNALWGTNIWHLPTFPAFPPQKYDCEFST